MPNPVQQPAYQEMLAQQMKQLPTQQGMHLAGQDILNYQAMLYQQDPAFLQLMWLQHQHQQQVHI